MELHAKFGNTMTYKEDDFRRSSILLPWLLEFWFFEKFLKRPYYEDYFSESSLEYEVSEKKMFEKKG